MELVLGILFIVGIIIYTKIQDEKAAYHCNTYEVDWGKVNEDRIMNNLSETQINKNISLGKYDIGKKW